MQNIELLTIAAFVNLTESQLRPSISQQFFKIVTGHFNQLIRHCLLWDATRIFSIYCHGALDRDDSVVGQYDGLMRMLEGNDIFSSSVNVLPEDGERLLCALAANEALMKYLNRCTYTLYQDMDKKQFQFQLLARSITAIERLFNELHKSRPRGSRLSFWKRMSVQLDSGQEVDYEAEYFDKMNEFDSAWIREYEPPSRDETVQGHLSDETKQNLLEHPWTLQALQQEKHFSVWYRKD